MFVFFIKLLQKSLPMKYPIVFQLYDEVPAKGVLSHRQATLTYMPSNTLPDRTAFHREVGRAIKRGRRLPHWMIHYIPAVAYRDRPATASSKHCPYLLQTDVLKMGITGSAP